MSAGLAMMPWFPGDFMRSTRGWSVTAKGVYRELLDAQWDMGDLPADPEELRATIGATAEEWDLGWKKCEAKFPIKRSARRNLRLETHRAKSELIANVRSEVGRKGGQASVEAKAKQRLTNGSALLQANPQPIAQAKLNHPVQSSPIHSESSPDHTKLQNGKGKERSAGKTPPIDPAWLSEFKMLYPKRGGDANWKGAARAGSARIAEGHHPSEFLEGAQRYREFCAITGKIGTEYVKQAATFLGPAKPFLEPWEPPATKADVRLGTSLTAAEEFMRRTEPNH